MNNENLLLDSAIFINYTYNIRFIYLGETFTPVQLVGALVTVAAIYMVNYKTDEA